MNKIYLLVLTALCLNTLQANTIYVKQGATGSNDGSSWNNAYASLHTAIDSAKLGDEVWVAAGTYNGSFVIKEGVNVYGSFAGNETIRTEKLDTTTNKTVLNGGDTCRVLTQQASFGTPTIWSGFIIRDGNASKYYPSEGGGASIQGGMTLQYCLVMNNVAYKGDVAANVSGGGIQNNGGTIANCIIKNNTAYAGTEAGTGQGGGIYASENSTIYNCLIESNAANSSPASGQGGGIYAVANTNHPTYIFNCTIVNNEATTTGGVFGSSLYCEINNCITWNNQSGNINDSPEINNTIQNTDPQFVDAANGDYRLAEGSPAIEAGDNDSYLSDKNADKDLAGNRRWNGSRIDMGAYEYTGEVALTSVGNIVYVSNNQTANNPNGSSWENASSIYDAFEMAANYPDEVTEIHIARGEYLINDSALIVSSTVKVIGGLIPNTNGGINTLESTILKSGGNNRVLIVSGSNILPNEYITPEFHNLVIANGDAKDEKTVSNNLIALDKGGGVYVAKANVLFQNVVVTKNNATDGGGIYVGEGELDLENVTITRNTSAAGGGVYSLAQSTKVFNSIIWGNSSNDVNDNNIFTLPNALDCRYSLVEGKYDSNTGNLDGTNNINNPMLTNVGDYIYGLLPSSPAINKGEGSAYAPGSQDIEGQTRIYNATNSGIIDLGAYEFQGNAPLKITFPFTTKPDSITYRVDGATYSQTSDSTWLAGYETDFAFRLRYVNSEDSSFYTVSVGTDTLRTDGIFYVLPNVTANKTIAIKANTYKISFPDSLIAGIKEIRTIEGNDSLATKHGSTFQFQLTLDSAYVNMIPAIRTNIDSIKVAKIDSLTADSTGIYVYQIANVRQNLQLFVDSLEAIIPDSCTVTIPEIPQLITDPTAGIYKVGYGDSLVLSFRLAEGYKEFNLHLVINGDSVQNFATPPDTTGVSETLQTYSVSLRSDSSYTYIIRNIMQNLIIKFNGVVDGQPVANEAIAEENGAKIYAYDGYLYVETPKACQLAVYSITGRTFANKLISEGTTTIQIPKGIYIVRAGNTIQKVFVK